MAVFCDKLIHHLAHFGILFLHRAKEFELSPGADEVVLRIFDFIVCVPVELVHKEAQHLLKCDIYA